MNPIYEAAKEALGKHITLNDDVPPDLGCAESISVVLKNAGVANIPPQGFEGTWGLYQWLSNNKDFQEVPTAVVGSIVISPTGMSSQGANKHGHTGCVLKYGIASNNSNNGRFEENYTVENWEYSFAVEGFPTFYFKWLGYNNLG